jgi:lysophospholipase L1-like esterase
LVLLLSFAACKESATNALDPSAANTTASTAGTTTSGSGNDGSTTGGASTAGDSNAISGTVAGVSESIHYVGRFVKDANDSMTFSWSGSQISTQFQGTGISMALDEINNISSYGANMYDISIDNAAATRITATAGGGSYTLASNLAQGLHTISVTKRTEASIGPARFRGFTVTGGSIVPQVSSVTKRMLMIGDSITCGYGILGTSSTCSFSSATQNAALTYGALAAKHFAADVQFTSWSGKGIYRNNDGTTDATMLDLYNLALPSDATTSYDWTQFVPDAIVINLGTNDFSATYGEPSASSFKSAYLQMLTTLNTAYPKAHIFLVAGPMVIDNYPVGTTYLTDLKTYLAAVAQASPNSNTTVLEMTSLTDAQKGCDSHPNQAAHAIMAQTLQAAMSAALGW